MVQTTQTILLADENDTTRAFLQDNLTADGYQVRAAADRAKATALLAVDRPALIIVDLNGQTLELLAAIRSGQELAVDPDTPIIVLSHRLDDLHRIRVLDRGGDDVIAKPFSYPELRARVSALLRRAQSRHRPRQLRFGPHHRSRQSPGAPRRSADRAPGQGIRAARHARLRPAPRVHPARVAAERLGLPHALQDS